jgi:pyruvate/2-oxoglutarate dehydrogenase complex dihydrolipoamide acyltransferase (E2) component
MSTATNRAAEEDVGALRAEINELQTNLAQMAEFRTELEAERSKGFWRRLFRLPPRAPEDTERARERIRGRIALSLITTLIIVVGLTFWYLLMLSRNFGALKTDDLNTLIPMVGTTLLTPLVGLIGAVTGFYYGGQTAVQAASQATQAASQGAQTATNAATQGAQTATHAATQATSQTGQRPAQAATEAATEAATKAATEAATKAATEAATKAAAQTGQRPAQAVPAEEAEEHPGDR